MASVVKITILEWVLDWLCPNWCASCGEVGSALCRCCKKNIKRAEVVRRDSSVMVVDGGDEKCFRSKECGSGKEKCFGSKECGRGEEMRGGRDEEGRKRRAEIDIGRLRGLAAVSLKDGKVRKLIHQYKYQGQRFLARELTEMMAEAAREAGFDAVGDGCRADFGVGSFGAERGEGSVVVIVPLPTIRRHIRERGFDHALRLAEGCAERLGVGCEEMLMRVGNGVQVGKGAVERERQAKQAYKLREGVKIEPRRRYVLVDDVFTTGASMRAAAEVLWQAGAREIYGLVAVKA